MPDGSILLHETHALRAAEGVDANQRALFEQGLLKYRPNLKAFACSLARNTDAADDLVQETMARALRYRDKFDCNTNQRAWLFTILKNLFRSKLRRDGYETELTDVMENSLAFSSSGAQIDALFFKEVTASLKELPASQYKAVVLVGALGHSLAEVAALENCPVGTIKSRVSRGRRALSENLAL